MILLRNLLFYVIFYGGTIAMLLAAVPVIFLAPRKVPPMCDGWSHFHRWCVCRLLGITIREEGVKPEGACLFAFRHESFFEAIDFPTTLRRPVIFAKQELFSIPIWGRAAHIYGVVPVARMDGARALRNMIAQARAHADDGRPLAIFPEGTRVPHGQARKLRSGFAGLYKMIGLPVVPVAVDSGPLYHRGLKRPGTITFRFGEAIPAGLPRAEIEEKVHSAINALN
ncbi:1-acyl-sn-glycerol-3-phosphate acyltransferase [Altericroceibacterium spongiae]|uniref:1-acyl-sn-glycerol-3-phosphate acyltransferase n=2 Tax=Altericroceibacterium spongiae TaxID=2320269 RepID=A0A420EQ45_9SPHN|nr:lysophospholipid acyltransferase family protein [Altericroceibacterium spongiae]RKF22788.1 1-acyl-sn-glycerol-3-phosphate acyltransferase [Altericroceibacterium spongiae]